MTTDCILSNNCLLPPCPGIWQRRIVGIVAAYHTYPPWLYTQTELFLHLQLAVKPLAKPSQSQVGVMGLAFWTVVWPVPALVETAIWAGVIVWKSRIGCYYSSGMFDSLGSSLLLINE